jgi:glycosyltransferase involved in cell wall biosynthesis
VGGHHIARALVAEGWDVAYVTNPISPLHLARVRAPELRDRFRIWRHGGLDDLDGHLWAYVPGALLTPHRAPLLRSRMVHRRWHDLTLPNVAGMARRHGFGSVDLLYIDSVVQAFWLRSVEHRHSVLRISDRMTGFTEFTPEMHRLEADLARRVDLVAYSASTLAEYVNSLRPRRSLHLPNGVDLEHFLGPVPAVPADLEGIRRPIAVYVGALDDWFDFAAVDRLARDRPDVSIVLIGPDERARAQLPRRANLHLLGRRPFEALPAYLRHADVGLIPFDVRGHPDLVRSIHPLKLYEYLACGLPVVAARWVEMDRLASPAILYDEPDQITTALERALANPVDGDAALDYATAADWRGRVRTLLAALG